ncbi:MAG: hypothetical protein J4G09_13760 [Proteobacteria bacterium]|nr:hypothetical protein [Pseudomonadota bacterium]
MLFLHETHRVKGNCEEDFESAIRDGWMKTLAAGDDARLLWYTHHAHGSGASYQVVTLTALVDGAAWERLARRVQSGDLQAPAAELDELRHDVTGKLLLPVYWSPLQEVDLSSVPTDGREHEPTLFMEDTGWPHAPLDEYIRFWDVDYYRWMRRQEPGRALLDIQACFQIAHGTHRRREAVLWQKIVEPKGLLHLLTHEVPPEHKAPDSYMARALHYRDQWESRLLRTSRWSPLY